MDIGKDIANYVGGMNKNLPDVLKGEAEYRPQWQKLNLGDTDSFLNGTGGQMGLIGQGGQAQAAAQGQLNDARASELANMGANTGTVRGLLGSLSPESARAVNRADLTARDSRWLEQDFMARAGGMMDAYGSQVGGYGDTLGGMSGYVGSTIGAGQAQGLLATTLGGINSNIGTTVSGANADPRMAQQMAQEAFDRRGSLSQEEQRGAQQQAREASIASGRIGGNAAIASEVLNREAAMAGRRSEAAAMGQQAYGQSLGAAQQSLNNEQALYGQRASNVDRGIGLNQAMFGQNLAASQDRLAQQNARYSQLGADQERELARQQNLFGQGLAGGQQRAAERQFGFGQLMDIDQRRGQMREETANANARAYDMGNGFYSQPGFAMLGMTPASMGLGQNYLTQGLGAIGSGTPQMYDIGAALNMGAAQRQNQVAAAAANAQAQASYSAGMMGGIGQMGGAAIAAI